MNVHRLLRPWLVPLLLAQGCHRADPAPAARPIERGAFTLVTWNLESGDSSIEELSRYIAEAKGVDIWALNEVPAAPTAGEALLRAAAAGEPARFESVAGTTGGDDRLLLIFNADRLTLESSEELHAINPGGRVRSPLVAHLREQNTGLAWSVVVNHLYRSRAEERLRQAHALRQWAEANRRPIVLAGDLNFDWNVVDGESDHDPGYDALVQGGEFRWVRPPTLTRTQCGGRYNTVLDFVFLSREASHWQARSHIAQDDPAFCDAAGVPHPFRGTDDAKTSDHKPVWVMFRPAP